jgi:hypothetical protein
MSTVGLFLWLLRALFFVGPVLFRLGLIVTLGILNCIEISVVAIIVWFLMLHAIVFVRWLLLDMVVTILL